MLNESLFRLLLAAALAAAAPGPALAQPSSAAAECQIVDLMPPFWSFWDAARDRDAATQVALFQKMLQAPYAAVYDGVLRNIDIPLSQLVPQSIERAKPSEAVLRRLTTEISAQLPAQLQLFRSEFADFSCSTPVYFLYSVGTFDGATRGVSGRTALLFGVDVIARLHGEHLTPLAVHELFHVHHGNLLPKASEAFFWSMWREGLATYVSRRMSPELTEQEACCLPPIGPVQEAMPKILTEALTLLDSTRREDYSRYFLGGVDVDIPVRSGYYLGYLVARELGRTRSLSDLARMPPAFVRPMLEETLRRLH
jgi:hypothetical protein